MIFLFNLAKVHADVKNTLDSQEKLIVDTINELINFCNNELPNKQRSSPLPPMTSSLWSDSEVIPATVRLSTTKMGVNTGTEIVQRPTLKDKARKTAHLVTTIIKDSFHGNDRVIEDNISIFKALEKELRSRHAYLQTRLQNDPNNAHFQQLMIKTTLGLMMLEGLVVHAKNILSQSAALDCIDRVILPTLEEKVGGVLAFQAKTRLFNSMAKIIERHQYIGENNFKTFTKEDVLAARKEMDEVCARATQFITKNKTLSNEDKKVILTHIDMAKAFFYIKNDLNFSIPLEETTSSKLRRRIHTAGSTVSLVALGATLVATPLVFTPLAPIAAPVATAAALISLGTGLPVAISTGEQAFSNAIKYGVIPSQMEAVTLVAALGSLATAGLLNVVGGGLWSNGLEYMIKGGKFSLSTRAALDRSSQHAIVENARSSSNPELIPVKDNEQKLIDEIQVSDQEKKEEENLQIVVLSNAPQEALPSSSPGTYGLFSKSQRTEEEESCPKHFPHLTGSR